TKVLIVQKREVRPGVSGLAYCVRRKAGSTASGSTCNRADPTYPPRGCNVHDTRIGRIDNNRGDRTTIECRTSVSGSLLKAAGPDDARAVNACALGNTRVGRKMRPGIAAIG